MGNACVLKPGEDASQSALMIGELTRQAGFPPGVLNIIPGLGKEAGEDINIKMIFGMEQLELSLFILIEY